VFAIFPAAAFGRRAHVTLNWTMVAAATMQNAQRMTVELKYLPTKLVAIVEMTRDSGRLRRILLHVELDRNCSRSVNQPKLYPGKNKKMAKTGIIAAVDRMS
jgi:hypothetical protein